MEIKLVKIAEIKPYDRNPRNNDGAVDAVAASIKEFGWQQPIVVDRDGVIIAGHTRYKAAQKLKCKEVPVVVAENLTDEQVRAYRLADNKTGELAGWDFSALDEELAGIAEIDMSLFGFVDKEMAEAVNLSDEPEDGGDNGGKLMHCPKCGFVFEVK
nr:MAG TPA: ParB protein [Caudoviricetes sp.]